MEAWNSVDPASPDKIVVRATKDEWHVILFDMHEPGSTWPPEVIDLINQLKKVGVEY